MPATNNHSDKQNPVITVVQACVRGLKFLFHGFLVPVVRDLWRVATAMTRPVTQMVVSHTVSGVRSLHGKKHWARRSGVTLWGNAIGLCIAMVSAQLISHFIEVRGAGNLWGLFSKRTLVSENSYRLVSFVVEFLVTLIVFSVIEYYVDQRRQRRTDDVDRVGEE